MVLTIKFNKYTLCLDFSEAISLLKLKSIISSPVIEYFIVGDDIRLSGIISEYDSDYITRTEPDPKILRFMSVLSCGDFSILLPIVSISDIDIQYPMTNQDPVRYVYKSKTRPYVVTIYDIDNIKNKGLFLTKVSNNSCLVSEENKFMTYFIQASSPDLEISRTGYILPNKNITLIIDGDRTLSVNNQILLYISSNDNNSKSNIIDSDSIDIELNSKSNNKLNNKLNSKSNNNSIKKINENNCQSMSEIIFVIIIIILIAILIAVGFANYDS